MSVNLAELSQEITNLDNRKNNSQNQDWMKKYVKFPDGEGYIIVRLLPPRNENEPFYSGIKRHTINKKKVTCLKHFDAGFWKGDCPICEYASSLWVKSESPDLTERQVKELRDAYSAIKGRPRFFFNCIVREEVDEKGVLVTDVMPKILSTNQELKDYIIRSMIGDKTKNKKGLGDVTLPETGRDLNIVQSKNAGGWPDYKESEFLEVSVLSKDKKLVEKWMSNMHSLVERKMPTVEELKNELNVFLGITEPSDTQFNKSDFEKTEVKTVVKKEPVTNVVADIDMALDADDILRDLDIDV